MIVELVAGAAFLGCLGVLVVQMTGWRPRRRSWGDAPIVHDMPVATSLAPAAPAPQRVEVVIRIEVQGPDA